MAAKDDLGRRGEQLAADYLGGLGLQVLERNWRCPDGELDIIAAAGRDLVVVCEVKTRAGTRFGAGSEAVDWRKARRIRRLTSVWLSQRDRRHPVRLRFDVISVLCAPGAEPELTHLAGAF